MFSLRAVKLSVLLLIIAIVLINSDSLEARRISGGSRSRSSSGRSSGSRTTHSGGSRSSSSSSSSSGRISKPSVPVYVPKLPVHKPSIPHTPPHTSGSSSSNSGKESSNILIHSEGGGRTRPVNDQRQQSTPHQPSAPHEPIQKTNAGNVNSQGNPHGSPNSPYPDWANPSAGPHGGLNPHAPSAGSPHPSQQHGSSSGTNLPFNPSHGSQGKPPGPIPSAPYPPIHPPGPISNHPITPTHQSTQNSGLPHGMPMPQQPSYPYPNSPHGMPPPYQPSAPYPVGHPQGMPTPNAPHIGFGNGGHGGHQPIGAPVNYPPIGTSPMGPHAGMPQQPTIVHNHYHPSPPIGSPQNPAGHPIYSSQPVYGGAPMAQPFVPGQTVVVLPNQQHADSGRGLGQIFKEALVFSTVNAGVNRIINGPSHHHHDSYPSSSQSVPPATASSSSSTVTNTVIYNNQYGNPIPGPNGTPVQGTSQSGDASIAVPPSPGSTAGHPVPMGSGTIPIGTPPNPDSNTPTGTAGSSLNIGHPGHGTSGTGTHPSPVASGTSNPPNQASSGNTGQNGIIQPTNSTGNQTAVNPVPEFQYFIPNEELWNLTESLFEKEEFDVNQYITLNLQTRSVDPNVTDKSPGPLLYVRPDAYAIPTINAIRDMFDNYEFDSEKKEFMNIEKRREENFMLDALLNTNIMAETMKWLSGKGYVEPDDFEWKDTLRHIWFSKVNGATSGFERIFIAEKYPGPSILGAQNWVYFDYQETFNRIDYMSYSDKLNLNNKASLVKVNFKIDDIAKPNTTMLIGTTPELEMALYTICYYTRPNDLCSISLAGVRFNVYTHAFRYFGKDVMDLGIMMF